MRLSAITDSAWCKWPTYTQVDRYLLKYWPGIEYLLIYV